MNTSLILAALSKSIGLACSILVSGILLGCTQVPWSTCREISDIDVTKNLLLSVRPEFNAVSLSGISSNTLVQHLEKYTVSYRDCGRTYKVSFVPKAIAGGRVRVEDKVTYVIDSKTGKTFHRYTGAAGFEKYNSVYFERNASDF